MARKKGGGKDDPRWTSDLVPAPGELRIVQAFLNTAAGFKKGTDELASLEALAGWLDRWGLVAGTAELGMADVARAAEARAGLRATIRARDGAPREEAIARLDRAAHTAPVRIRFGAEGTTRLEPTADGLDGALARLFGIVVLARADGTWPRLKLCVHERCRAAFYDFSTNLAGKWCTARCGNRLSARTYRRRLRDRFASLDPVLR